MLEGLKHIWINGSPGVTDLEALKEGDAIQLHCEDSIRLNERMYALAMTGSTPRDIALLRRENARLVGLQFRPASSEAPCFIALLNRPGETGPTLGFAVSSWLPASVN